LAHNCDLDDSVGVASIDLASGARASLFEGTLEAMAGLSADGGSGLLPLGGSEISSPVAFLASTFNASSGVVVACVFFCRIHRSTSLPSCALPLIFLC